MIRSLGGWTESRHILKDREHVMSDERILGDSAFVDFVISQSEEQYERRYQLKQKGFNAEVLTISPYEVISKDRQSIN